MGGGHSCLVGVDGLEGDIPKKIASKKERKKKSEFNLFWEWCFISTTHKLIPASCRFTLKHETARLSAGGGLSLSAGLPWKQVPRGHLGFFWGFFVCHDAKTATRWAAQVGGAEIVFSGFFFLLLMDFSTSVSCTIQLSSACLISREQ